MEAVRPAGPDPGSRAFFSMVAVGPRCLCFGGRDINQLSLGTLAVYDASMGSWAHLPSIPGPQPAPRSSHTYAQSPPSPPYPQEQSPGTVLCARAAIVSPAADSLTAS